MDDLKLMVTLLPSFPHFPNFSRDKRLSGIRLNSAMTDMSELDTELELIGDLSNFEIPLYFDIKGWQLRIAGVHDCEDHLEITLNHSISVKTPTEALFKAGEDWATLIEVSEDGRRLIFEGGPQWSVKAGESLHIRDESLVVSGEFFSQAELDKIEKVRKFGFNKYFLSYVQSQEYVDQFMELVGKDAEVRLKIEDRKGLEYIARHFRKTDNIKLVAARGDMFVEVKKPHEILAGLKTIIKKDPEACAGSRIMLSVVQPSLAEVRRFLQDMLYRKTSKREIEDFIEYLTQPQIPSCADFSDLAWLYDLGYREMMLCDEICLKDDLLGAAVNAFDAFKNSYAKTDPVTEITQLTAAIAPEKPKYNGASGWSMIKEGFTKLFQQYP